MRRTGERDPDKLLAMWNSETESAVEIELDKVGRVLALTGHQFKDSRYFRSPGGWVFVVSGGLVVTVHHGTAKRFLNATKKTATA
jgi:hypothetical protein